MKQKAGNTRRKLERRRSCHGKKTARENNLLDNKPARKSENNEIKNK